MSETVPFQEPMRPADVARLQLLRRRIEDGVRLEDLFREATETAAELMCVDRASVWLLVQQSTVLRCIDLFEATRGNHSSGVTIHVADFPRYFEALEHRKTLPAEMAQTDPRTVELAESYLIPLGITSLLDAPILLGGELVGVICLEHTGPPREWSTEERDFVGSIADLLALKIKASEVQEARLALQTQAEQLAETRRIHALAEMAAGIAHDFTNILATMIGAADLIAGRLVTGETLTQTARQISETGHRGVVLIRELLGYARPTPPSSRVISPAEELTGWFSQLQAGVGTRHQLILDIQSARGRVLMAPSQLERAVQNLLSNARDAMPEGGIIRVAVDQFDQIEDGRRVPYVRIQVIDQGEGISEAIRERIFDPFFTTKPRGQGTGLGLAIVQQVANYVGGRVRVFSEPGVGSTFEMLLPCVSSSH
jgi:signal transduction histidine kinase